MESGRIGIFIAVPTLGFIRHELANWIFQQHSNPGYDVTHCFSVDRPIEVNRNKIVEAFLKSDKEWLLMVDSDVLPCPEVLELTKQGKDIITPWICVEKDGERLHLALDRVDGGYKAKKVLHRHKPTKVDATGTGCLFINRRVFKKMRQPYFRMVLELDGSLNMGEDFYFCEQAKDAGFDVWFHMGYKAQHLCERWVI